MQERPHFLAYPSTVSTQYNATIEQEERDAESLFAFAPSMAHSASYDTASASAPAFASRIPLIYYSEHLDGLSPEQSQPEAWAPSSSSTSYPPVMREVGRQGQHSGIVQVGLEESNLDEPGLFDNQAGPLSSFRPAELSPTPAPEPHHGWTWAAVVLLAYHSAVLAAAIYLYKHPLQFSLTPQYFVHWHAFHLTPKSYNTLVQFLTTVLSAVVLGVFGQVIYAYLVQKLGRQGMSHLAFARTLFIGSGRISWKGGTRAIAITGLVFLFFTSYSAALAATFTLNQIQVSSVFPLLSANVSANAVGLNATGLATGDTSQVFYTDYESTLMRLGANWGGMGFSTKVPVTIDNAEVLPATGMIYGASTPASISSRLESGATPSTPLQRKLIIDQYGSNYMTFNASGVQAVNTCGPPSPPLRWATVTDIDGYLHTTINGTACGTRTRVHVAPLAPFFAYDVLSCATATSITTVVFAINENGTLVDSSTCGTTLSDTFGVGNYLESMNTYLESTPYQSAPMTSAGITAVQQYTTTGWIQNLGRSGSQGLFSIFSQLFQLSDATVQPLNFSTPTSVQKLEYTVSTLYAIGGAKLVNIMSNNALASLQNTSVRTKTTWTTQESEVIVRTAALEIGMDGSTVAWLAILILHFAVGAFTLVLAWYHPSTNLDPSMPTTLYMRLRTEEGAGKETIEATHTPAVVKDDSMIHLV